MKWTLLQTQSNQWFFNNLLFSPSNSVYDVYPAIIQLFSIPREPAARFYKLDSQSDGTLLLMCEVSHSITHSAAWLHCTQAHSMESRCWLNVQTSKSLRHPPPHTITLLRYIYTPQQSRFGSVRGNFRLWSRLMAIPKGVLRKSFKETKALLFKVGITIKWLDGYRTNFVNS